MRRITAAVIAVLASAALLAACGGNDPEAKRYAFVTDSAGTDTDEMTAQTWAGTRSAADLKPCMATAYTTQEEDAGTAARMKAAVKDGAKVIVCSGKEMEEAVETAQKRYKKVHFILTETAPASTGGTQAAAASDASAGSDVSADPAASAEAAAGNAAGGSEAEAAKSDAKSEDSSSAESKKEQKEDSASGEMTEGENTCVIRISERDAGYIAGYALVADGMTNLGFMGGPDDREYANGFIAGCDRAATEKALAPGGVTVTCVFYEDTSLSPLRMDEAMKWYASGIRAIYVPNAGLRLAVEKAAELTENGYVAASGFGDRSSESGRVLLTTTMDLSSAVQKAIQDFENDTFRGGETYTVGAIEGCVTIAADFTRFTQLTDTACLLLLNNLGNGQARIPIGDMMQGTACVTVQAPAAE